MKKLLGYFLISLPFIVIFIGGSYLLGIIPIILIFCTTALVMASVFGGTYLINSKENHDHDAFNT